MKFYPTALTILSLAARSHGFSIGSSVGPSQIRQDSLSTLKMTVDSQDDVVLSRRRLLGNGAALAIAFVGAAPNAQAGLLDEFGSEPGKISQKEEKIEAIVPEKKAESVIEPNLRSNYYYPTNKKRYLPRIKKCNDAIPEVAASIGTGDWEAVSFFA